MLFAITTLMSSLPATARAQWNAVPAGVRVQMLVENRSASANAGRTSLVQGLLVRSGDTLGVSPSEANATLLIPLASVKGLAVSKGVPSRQRSMIVGAIGGTILGALVAGSLNLAPLKNKGVSTRDLFAAGAYSGFIAGATLGSSTQRERWDWLPRR